MKSLSTSQSIREHISSLPAGKPFGPAEFVGLGSRASIDQTLMRLNKKGFIERLGHGLYTVPQTNRFGLKSMPMPETVVQAVAQAKGATVEIHGAEAARRFGFSTQTPTQPVFCTTGSSRTFQLGQLSVRMQHVSPRKLALAGRLAGQALSALWYLGKHQVTPTTFKQIASKLPEAEFEVLRRAKSSMPAWMADALRRFEEEGLQHG